jgi:hypothetical protein
MPLLLLLEEEYIKILIAIEVGKEEVRETLGCNFYK